jgi:hypothetical protein
LVGFRILGVVRLVVKYKPVSRVVKWFVNHVNQFANPFATLANLVAIVIPFVLSVRLVGLFPFFGKGLRYGTISMIVHLVVKSLVNLANNVNHAKLLVNHANRSVMYRVSDRDFLHV